MSKASFGQHFNIPGGFVGFSLTAILRVQFVLLSASFAFILILFVAPVCAGTTGGATDKKVVESVRLWRAPDHTRLVFDLSDAVRHQTFTLDNPNRLVIDISSAQFIASISQLDFSNTPINKLRSGVRNGSDLRIVLELKNNLKHHSFVLPENEQYGHRLVLDLYDPENTSDRSEDLKITGNQPADSKAGQERSVSDLIAHPGRSIIIAIDAGHGGEDPGAVGSKRIREKTVVLAISRRVEKLFDKEPGFEGVLVRTGDYYIPLRKRTAIARKRRADLMISIHADAFRQSSAHGASVYALSQRGASSENARYLADRENQADLIGGSSDVSLNDKDKMLAEVILDLSMTATLSASLEVGDEVARSIGGVARLHKRKVEQAGFVVLKSPDIPSILVETGFISNPGEARKLNQAAYQQKMAEAIFRGVQRYFGASPPDGTLLAMRRAQGLRGVATVYVIARGDTLSGIAQRHSISVRDLKKANGLSSATIRVGQKLKIPQSS